jgi:hypothetical protein
MDSTYELFEMDGEPEEFWRQRPELDDTQAELLNCYYVAIRDSKRGERCPVEAIERALSQCWYESDLALNILQQLDDHYLKLCADKLKRQSTP